MNKGCEVGQSQGWLSSGSLMSSETWILPFSACCLVCPLAALALRELQQLQTALLRGSKVSAHNFFVEQRKTFQEPCKRLLPLAGNSVAGLFLD